MTFDFKPWTATRYLVDDDEEEDDWDEDNGNQNNLHEKGNNPEENVTRIDRKRKSGKNRQIEETKNRNGGKIYESYRDKGQEQQKKIIGTNRNYKRKCFTFLTGDEMQNIFKAF